MYNKIINIIYNITIIDKGTIFHHDINTTISANANASEVLGVGASSSKVVEGVESMDIGSLEMNIGSNSNILKSPNTNDLNSNLNGDFILDKSSIRINR